MNRSISYIGSKKGSSFAYAIPNRKVNEQSFEPHPIRTNRLELSFSAATNVARERLNMNEELENVEKIPVGEELIELFSKMPELSYSINEDATANKETVFEIPKQKGQKQTQEEFPNVHHKGFDKEDMYNTSDDSTDEEEEASHLQILKFYPDQTVNGPQELRITFSHTMFTFPESFFLRSNPDHSGIETTPNHQLPVVLKPHIEGVWKWLNGNTVEFKPTNGFPMATTYTVTAPRGTASLLGAELADDLIFTFATPTVKLVSHYPETVDPNKLTPETVGVPDQVIVLEFNQNVDPRAIMDYLEVIIDENEEKKYTCDDFIILDASILDSTDWRNGVKSPYFIEMKERYAQLEEKELGCWVFFKVKEPLPTNSTIKVTIGAGTPSTQGPDSTTEPQSFTFKTYGPCRIRSIDNRLVMGEVHAVYSASSISVKFTNPIDPEKFDSSYVEVTPKDLMNTEVTSSGELNLILSRGTPFRHQCKVIFKKEIQDIFGQTLEKTESLTLRGRFTSEITSPLQGICVMSSSKPPQYPFLTNFNEVLVTISQVDPENFVLDMPDEWSGTVVNRAILQIKVNEFREMKETVLDLQEFLKYPKENLGHLLVEIEPTAEACGLTVNYNARPRLVSWLQCTDLAITAFEGQEAPYALVTSLRDGRPIKGAKLDWGSWAPTSSLWAKMGLVRSTQTGKGGLTQLSIPIGSIKNSYPLIAQLGNDISFLPIVSVLPSPYEGHYIFYVMNDNPVYYPGDSVILKGWTRRVTTTQEGHIRGLEIPSEKSTVEYVVTDSTGKPIDISGDVAISKTGAFDIVIRIPGTFIPGDIVVEFSMKKKMYYKHHLTVYQKSTPDFRIQSQSSQGPYIIGSDITSVALINYQNGGNYANGKVLWEAYTESALYSPPGWDEYLFGPNLSSQRFPWENDEIIALKTKDIPFEKSTTQFRGKTDFQGTHATTLSLKGDLKCPAKVTSSITVVTDKWTQSHYIESLVHPAAYYVGVKRTNFLLSVGEPLSLSVIVTDINGKFISNIPVLIEIYLVGENGKEFKMHNEEIKIENEPKLYEWSGVVYSGEHRVRVLARDPLRNTTEITARFWVVPSNTTIQNFYGINIPYEHVVLIPNKSSYAVGETAKITVQSPLSGSFTGVLQISSPRCDQIISRFDRNKRSFVLDVRIDESFVPSAVISVVVEGIQYRSIENTHDTRPAYGHGSVELCVPPVKNEIQVKVVPLEPVVKPGSKTSLEITVCDKTEACISKAEVALIVMNNDAVIASGFKVPSPLATMFPGYDIQYYPKHLRAYTIVDNYLEKYKVQSESQQPDTPIMSDNTNNTNTNVVHGSVSSMNSRKFDSLLFLNSSEQTSDIANTPIKIRSNFRTLAAFIPSVRTDQEGKVCVEISLPDTIARYKVIAVASWGPSHFGVGEAFFDTYLPFIIQPSAPRFLTLGDTSQYSVVVANRSEENREITVGIRGTNITIADEVCGYRVTVPANKRVAISFTIAPTATGQAHIQVGAMSGNWSDAAETIVPIRSSTQSRCIVSYLALTVESVIANHLINLPKNINPKYGSLSVVASSNRMQAIGDSLKFIHCNAHNCTESIASRLLSYILLHGEFGTFSVEGLPDKEKLLLQISEDIMTLKRCQNENGSFSYWSSSKKHVDVFVSIHVCHAIARATSRNSKWKNTVPMGLAENCKKFLCELSGIIQKVDGLKKNFGINPKPKSRLFLLCYTTYVRWLFYENIYDYAETLVPMVLESNSIESAGLLLSILSRNSKGHSLLQFIQRYNLLSHTNNREMFITNEYEGDDGELYLYHSPIRAAAIILNGISDIRHKDKLASSVLKFISDARTEDARWGSTQENAWVCIALWKYFRNIDQVTDDQKWATLSARIFYNNSVMCSPSTTEVDSEGNIKVEQVLINTELLVLNAKTDFENKITIQKEGPKVLYYRLALDYTLLSNISENTQISKGFTIERKYFSVNKDVLVRDSPGLYITKVGSLVQILIKISTLKNRHHLVLIDECPSAMEPLPEHTNEEGDDTESGYGLQWYQHQRVRQNRLEIYSTILYPGEHIYTYYARATSTGIFNVPPARVQELYSNHYGVSMRDTIIVKSTTEDVYDNIVEQRRSSKAPSRKAHSTSRNNLNLSGMMSIPLQNELTSPHLHQKSSGLSTVMKQITPQKMSVPDDDDEVLSLDKPTEQEQQRNKGKTDNKKLSFEDDEGFENIIF